MTKAKETFSKAKQSFKIGGTNTRAYVEEFYAIYEEDFQVLEQLLL